MNPSPPITKALLAKELGVTPQAVSAYVADGLPVREDGKVNRDEALAWIGRNRHLRIGNEDKGAVRARRITGRTASPADDDHLDNANPVDAAAYIVQNVYSTLLPSRIAALAVEAGLDIDTSRKLHDLVLDAAPRLGREVLDFCGLLPGFRVRLLRSMFIKPDWTALAAKCPSRKG